MPVYEYECLDCKRQFSEVKPISAYDPNAVKCPKCESGSVQRRWTSVFVETTKKS